MRALALLALPLIAVPTVYVVLSERGGGGSLPIARGSIGGIFHPAAGGFEPDSTTLEGCDGDPRCLEQAFGNLAFRRGPRHALGLFRGRMAGDDVVREDCHRIAHTIGSAALKRFAGDVARTFSHGSPICVSGYYHGILERALLGISSEQRLANVARSLCAAEGIRRRGFLDYQCRHGLGHGLMIQTGFDLPLALSVCSRLGSMWDHRACASGAFMENVDTRFGYRSPWLDDNDPLYPCRRVASRDRRSCYLRASWRILTLNGGDYAKTIAACADLGRWARTCFQGFGRDVAENAGYMAAEIVHACARAGSGQGDCLLGAARTIANASGLDGIAQATTLCRQSPPSARADCFAGVGLVVGMLYPGHGSRRSACTELAPEYTARCTAAADAEVDPSGRAAWG